MDGVSTSTSWDSATIASAPGSIRKRWRRETSRRPTSRRPFVSRTFRSPPADGRPPTGTGQAFHSRSTPRPAVDPEQFGNIIVKVGESMPLRPPRESRRRPRHRRRRRVNDGAKPPRARCKAAGPMQRAAPMREAARRPAARRTSASSAPLATNRVPRKRQRPLQKRSRPRNRRCRPPSVLCA